MQSSSLWVDLLLLTISQDWSENVCFTSFSSPVQSQKCRGDPSAPNPWQVWVRAPGKPISALPQALPLPKKNKNQPLLHRFPIAQGYNGLSSECIKWSLTIISSLCACNATASYKWFLMTHAVPRSRVIAIKQLLILELVHDSGFYNYWETLDIF